MPARALTKEESRVAHEARKMAVSARCSHERDIDPGDPLLKAGAAGAFAVIEDVERPGSAGYSDMAMVARGTGNETGSDQLFRATEFVAADMIENRFEPSKASDVSGRILGYAAVMQWGKEIYGALDKGDTTGLNPSQAAMVSQARLDPDMRDMLDNVARGRFHYLTPEQNQDIQAMADPEKLPRNVRQSLDKVSSSVDALGDEYSEGRGADNVRGAYAKDPSLWQLNKVDAFVQSDRSTGNVRADAAIRNHYEAARGAPWDQREAGDPFFDVARRAHARILGSDVLSQASSEQQTLFAMNEVGIRFHDRPEGPWKHGFANDRDRMAGKFDNLPGEDKVKVANDMADLRRVPPTMRLKAKMAENDVLKTRDRDRDFAPDMRQRVERMAEMASRTVGRMVG